MTVSDWRKILKQLESKPEIKAKFLRFNKPKTRKTGFVTKQCKRCGRIGGHLSQYGLNLCRQCFREIAEEIGFRKYS